MSNKKTSLITFALFFLTVFVLYICLSSTWVAAPLLPQAQSAFPWTSKLSTDVMQGGASSLSLVKSEASLKYEFVISDATPYPYIDLGLMFSGKSFTDLSAYSKIAFNVKCIPANVLSLTLFAYDQNVTKPDDVLSYRIPGKYFSCSEAWQAHVIDLGELDIPQWWYQHYGVDLSDTGYRLDSIESIHFGVSSQSIHNAVSQVEIKNIELRGIHAWYVSVVVVLLALWLGWAGWLIRQQNARRIASENVFVEKPPSDLSYVAAETPVATAVETSPRLSGVSRQKEALFQYLRANSTNPELNLEGVARTLGINRNKINKILKDEQGLTFSGYLKKLRLDDAVRQLSANADVNVTEVALSVGYNNVSYFIKVFKSEYGCTPKAYFNQRGDEESDGKDSP